MDPRAILPIAASSPHEVGGDCRREYSPPTEGEGLTQEQLAQEAEIAMRYIAGVERGEENPSLRYLVKIAEALDAEPADLLHRQVTPAGSGE